MRPPEPQPEPAAHWSRAAAVLIGIHSYDHLTDQPSIRNNLHDLRTLLVSDSFGLPAEQCEVLENPRDPRLVLDAIVRASRITALRGGTLFVYYAGHGAVHPLTGRLLLSVADSRPHTPHTFLDFDQMRSLIAGCAAAARLVVLDCCYSGAALNTLSAAGTGGAPPAPLTIEGSFLMSSSGPTELSYAPQDARHTAFTGVLLDILHKGLPNGPPTLDAEAVYEGIRLVCAEQNWPEPQRFVRNGGSRIPLLSNPSRLHHRRPSEPDTQETY